MSPLKFRIEKENVLIREGILQKGEYFKKSVSDTSDVEFDGDDLDDLWWVREVSDQGSGCPIQEIYIDDDHPTGEFYPAAHVKVRMEWVDASEIPEPEIKS